jgi:hypothetical protein
MRLRSVLNALFLQEQDSSVPSRMTNSLWADVLTITVTYPYYRSQIPRYALNDDEAGRGTSEKFGEVFPALDSSRCYFVRHDLFGT